jgi:asparagine synthase (glutamine-hydrolysing)
MCGICGTLGFGSAELLRRMADRIVHRGPDDKGFLVDREHGIYLANRRLSILDIEHGRQPIWDADEQVGVVYNGEIYNEPALRKELTDKGYAFRTRTDTEILPHLFLEHGRQAFPRLNGMFAFALWDRRDQSIWLVRDPIGIKPLFIWQGPEGLAFASEIKCFLEIPGFRAQTDIEALHLSLNVRFIPGRQTLFKNVCKLPQAHYLTWQQGHTEQHRYWTLPAVEPDMDIPDAIDGFYTRLESSVARQIRADVPLGVYLSGGIDSSQLVAALTRRGIQPDTFCLGFGEPTDELEDARRVADCFGTRHHQEVLHPESLGLYPQAIYHLEEPKVNGLQGFRLAQAVRRHFKVALSGLGGDELLCGYDIYAYLRRMLHHVHLQQPIEPLRKLAVSLIELSGFTGGFRADNIKRIIEWGASAGDLARMYILLRNAWDTTDRIGRWLYKKHVWQSLKDQTRTRFEPLLSGSGNPYDRVLRCELQMKMTDDFLVNGDRMSMASGLEERVPFLDLELVSFMARVPAAIKFRDGTTKWIVKQPHKKALPDFILQKKKWGFTFDSVEQARKDLLTAARETLTRDGVEALGVFRYEAVEQLMHTAPHPALRWHFFLLWMILGFAHWHRIFVQGEPPPHVVP